MEAHRERTYVGGITGVSVLEGSGDGDSSGGSATAASHGDVSAGDVELGDTCGPGAVFDSVSIASLQLLNQGT